MSRLVNKQPAPAGQKSVASVVESSPLQDYLERVVKYVPVEVVGAYLLIRGLVPAHGTTGALPPALEIGLYAALVALTPLYLARVAANAPRKAAQLAISTISFVVWSYAIGGPFFWAALSALVHTDVVVPAFAGPLAVVWALVAGRFAPTEQEAT